MPMFHRKFPLAQDNEYIRKIEHFQLPLSVFKCIKPNLLFINGIHAATER